MRSIRLRFFAGLVLVAATLRGGEMPVWQTDWNTAFQIAKEQHRMVFVEYTAKWCSECIGFETLTLKSPDVMERLSDFVLLRLDVGFKTRSRPQAEAEVPGYFIYDPAQRERFKIVGKGAGSFLTAVNLEELRQAAPAFLRAAELLDAREDLEAAFLVANTYSRLKMASRAREAYAEARQIADRRGDSAAAQIADAQSAFTFAREGDAPKAIKLLKALNEKPVNRDNEAILWLTLGHAYGVAKDTKSALASYTRAQSLAPRDSRTYAEASESIARLH
ncbi:MAG TPA: thioredoxin family protein [Thermoanaerobaculia bacterium]|jgi:tetratricopeptide (TPR) repeat protein|nr:thioredoxin family protein [Thermoanaerobaculia bacterium]